MCSNTCLMNKLRNFSSDILIQNTFVNHLCRTMPNTCSPRPRHRHCTFFCEEKLDLWHYDTLFDVSSLCSYPLMFTHWLASSLADTQQMPTLGVHIPKHFVVKCEQKETEANVRVFAWHVWDWIPFSELKKKKRVSTHNERHLQNPLQLFEKQQGSWK